MEVIAEIGWNHMGDMKIAEEMISQAAKAGADYAKFQSWSVKRLKKGEWDEDGRTEIYKKAELNKEKHEILINLCKSYEIKFLSSIFSIEDASMLLALGQKEVKIPSFEVANEKLLDFAAKNFARIFLFLLVPRMSKKLVKQLR